MGAEREQSRVGLASMLSVRRGAEAVAFCKAAFGASELFKIEGGGGVAQLARSVRPPLGNRQPPRARRRRVTWAHRAATAPPVAAWLSGSLSTDPARARRPKVGRRAR